jgi:uncharacterized membrane protein
MNLPNINPAHLHIILNHIPVLGIPFGIALFIYGFLRKSQEIRTAALLVFVAVALVTIPTFLSGEAAEDMVEHLPGVSERLIENHEDAAKIALIATSILGGLSLIRLLIPARFGAVRAPETILVFALSLAVSGWLGWTGHLGGQIRHSEIRSSSFGLVAARADDKDEEADHKDEEDADHKDEADHHEEEAVGAKKDEARENKDARKDERDEDSGRRRGRGRGRGRGR